MFIMAFLLVVFDRDQGKNMGVENSTFKVAGIDEHYEKLERYDKGVVYTVRRYVPASSMLTSV